MLLLFQSADAENKCTITSHRRFQEVDSGIERVVETNTDKLHDDDTLLRTADLSTFAWQIAKGMVRAGFRLSVKKPKLVVITLDQSLRPNISLNQSKLEARRYSAPQSSGTPSPPLD